MKEIKKLSAPGLYQAPSCEIFSVRTEGVLCQSVNGVTVRDLEYDGDELGC